MAVVLVGIGALAGEAGRVTPADKSFVFKDVGHALCDHRQVSPRDFACALRTGVKTLARGVV